MMLSVSVRGGMASFFSTKPRLTILETKAAITSANLGLTGPTNMHRLTSQANKEISRNAMVYWYFSHEI